MESEKRTPARRHHLGREPHAAARQQGAARALRVEEQGRGAGAFPRSRRSLDRHQRASAGDPAEHQAASRRGRPEDLGRSDRSRNGRARSPSPTRPIPARPIPTSPCWRRCGAAGDAGWEKVSQAARQHQGAQPLEPRVPGRRQRRISARHVARICRLPVVLERRAGEGDLSGRRHGRADGRRRDHQGRPEHRERQAVRRLRHAQGRARGDPEVRVPPAGAAGPRPLAAAGRMPQLVRVKLVDYDEDAWVEKRVETAQKIQDIIRRTR